ncbi:survival protein sure-like phosphatase/nucleotidase [Zopfochytrium polystomum]|nr:survival protein sure-like phosphatase/nucleotidase [Zopfochytrium polystomum]
MHVLLTNDDGPPGPDSPFLLPFVNLLRQANPTWRISIVIPDCQKSWIGKGFDYRSKRIGTSYFHIPSRSIRSVPPPPGEEDNYMILLDTTPAACVNIALNHIHPDPIGKPKPAAATAGTSSSSATAGSSGPAVASASSTGKQKSTGATADDDDDDDFEEDDPIDLVLSGPNFGRNSSAASSTSSGTVGAAIEAALLGKRAIALR